MNPNKASKDIFGLAVEGYYLHNDKTPIGVLHEDFFEDEIPVDYLFRTYEEMPLLEQKAIDLCEGSVLDVGCCAGSHSLELMYRGHQTKPIDISKKCIEICQKRGLKEAEQVNFFKLKPKPYDTILLLMNGIGIAGTTQNLSSFFKQLKLLMHQNSQVLLDSSDLIYLYDDEAPEQRGKYYGEMEYTTSYKNQISEPFSWLYLDFEYLKQEAMKENLDCTLLYSDEHYGFLARLELLN